MHLICTLSQALFLVARLTTQVMPASAQGEPSNVSEAGYPNPTATPSLGPKFIVHFENDHCSAQQQREIRGTLSNVAQMADRILLWQRDFYHDWEMEMKTWFGDDVDEQKTWIQSRYIFILVLISITDCATR